MTITTERLILRPWQESDAESLYEYAKDPLVGPAAGWPVHTSVENSREIIKNVLSDEYTFAVCLKEDNKAIGSIGLMAARTDCAAEGELEIGYWLGVPFWGRGYMPEAVRALQEYAFTELGCGAMWCGYYEFNEKSKRCMEKCGFTYHHTENDRPCSLLSECRTEIFTKLTRGAWQALQTGEIVIYIHGRGGNPGESERFGQLFPGAKVVGLEYSANTPWEAAEEFPAKIAALAEGHSRVTLIANSIGAYFAMSAGIGDKISRAFFISPVVDMEKLILDMLVWAGSSERELEEKKIIPVSFGDDLLWEYLRYVREHKPAWKVPTGILYGSADNMQSLQTVKTFAGAAGAELTVMEGGEHWFHTPQQLAFLDGWLKNRI